MVWKIHWEPLCCRLGYLSIWLFYIGHDISLSRVTYSLYIERYRACGRVKQCFCPRRLLINKGTPARSLSGNLSFRTLQVHFRSVCTPSHLYTQTNSINNLLEMWSYSVLTPHIERPLKKKAHYLDEFAPLSPDKLGPLICKRINHLPYLHVCTCTQPLSPMQCTHIVTHTQTPRAHFTSPALIWTRPVALPVTQFGLKQSALPDA